MDKPNYLASRARICADAMQTIADTVWDALKQAKTPAAAREALQAMQWAPSTNRYYVGQGDRWIPLESSVGAGGIELSLNAISVAKLTDLDLDWSDPDRQTGQLPSLAGQIDGTNDTFDLHLDDSLSDYPLASPASSMQVAVFLDDRRLEPNVDYSTTGEQITFATAPAVGSSIWALYYEVIDFDSLTKGTAVRLLYQATEGQTAFDTKVADAYGKRYTLRTDPEEPIDVYVNGERQPLDDGIGSGFSVNYSASQINLVTPATAGDLIHIDILTSAAGGVEVVALEPFAVDGTTVTFDLISSATLEAVQPFSDAELAIYIAGARLQPTVDYAVNGSEITFVSPPAADADIWGLWNRPLGEALQSSDLTNDFLEVRKNPANTSQLQSRIRDGANPAWTTLVDIANSVQAEEVPAGYTPAGYSPIGGASVRDHLNGISSKFLSLTAEAVASGYTPTAYSPIGGSSVRDHFEGIDAALQGAIEGVVVVAPNGNDANSGENHRAAVATLQRAVELTEGMSGHKVVHVYPAPNGYETEGELAWPDNTSVISLGRARATAIKPAAGHEESNVFLAGSGFYASGFSFEGWRIDDLENPSKGFGVAFRPGATIRRLPYIFDCVAYRASDPSLIPPPGDAATGNPLVGNGGGCVLADGAVCSQYSFPQIMTWGFTPSTPNGIGYCVKNGGLVNPLAGVGVFCRANMMALSGGRIQASGCATQFGDYAFWAAGSTDILDPRVTAGPLQVDASLGGPTGEIETNADTIIDAMWLDLVADYPSNPATGVAWTAEEEAFTRNDAGLFLLALRYCYASGRSESMENFTRGLFDYKGDYVFPAAMVAAFQHTFTFMAGEVKALTADATSKAMVDGLVAALNATLAAPVKRPEPSYINAVQHQMTLPGTGVTYAALPTLFGYQGQPKPMDATVYTDGVGRVDWSGSDDAGTTRWIGGARIDGLTGELGGPPVDAYVRRQIETGLVAAFGF